MSASETQRRYIWGCSSDEGLLDYDQTISALIRAPTPQTTHSSHLHPSRSTSLSWWHFGKSHCHRTFNKDKSLRLAAGDDWPGSYCAEYPSHGLLHSRLAFSFSFFSPLGEAGNVGKTPPNILTSPRISRCTDGSSGHQHTDTIITQKFVSLTLSFCFPGNHVYAHSTSPLTVRRLLPPRCQHSTG